MMASDDYIVHFVVQEDNKCEQVTKSRSPSDSPSRVCKSTQSKCSTKVSHCSKCSSQCGTFQLDYSNDFNQDVSRRASSSSSSYSEQDSCRNSQVYYYEDFHTYSSETPCSNGSGYSSILEQPETKEEELSMKTKENDHQAKACFVLNVGGKTLPKKKQRQKSFFNTSTIITSQKNNVACRLLSARLHKVKELKNEVSVLKKKLEASNMENQILKRLQYRHLKAISKYENAETNLPDLLAKQCGEVRTLRVLLRKSQEQERSASKKLREVEAQLLKTKDTLLALQKLSEDKNLAERGELRRRLNTLTQRMETGDKRIQVLEKQLLLNNTSFSHQLAVEKKKTLEAQLITTNLQMEIKSLNQKIKEKERELGVRNIYANRMLKGQQDKGGSESPPKAVNVSKSVQVDVNLEATALQKHEAEKTSVVFLKEEMTTKDINCKDKLCDVDKEMESKTEVHQNQKLTMQQILNIACTGEEICPNTEKLFRCENLERQKNRRERQRLNLLKEEFEKLRTDQALESTNDIQQKMNNQEEVATEKQENEPKQVSCDKMETVTQRYKTPSTLKKQYVFSEAVENLHQGYPSTGPLSNTSTTCSSRQVNRHQGEIAELKAENSSSAYEPSFGKVTKTRQKDTTLTLGKEHIPAVSTEKKTTLMEELFGPSCILKDSHSKLNLKEAVKEKKTLMSEKSYEISQVNDGLQCGDSKQAHIKVFHTFAFLENFK
nr:lebercilin-like protein isoform X1 [Podarcis muralis]XP_028583032.1 lebercilin-like protein isoform X1 [Podarcis muralis]XP_028583033.1 lebercilin-like protein isoform X1 [Podarcis muralis]XP_028583034.1 lebercilin-like protein isoform X1 [Podarcis muralis]XP_028583035.1 lebercilin-like protein isoform X1 [Podarcis muralis]XP_028583036.1 lebercilin-like protein isoform X1 [Podarcis muralis]XP_028583038.1 lebercilin-like protein isoform X1 [Podarcis muralis]